VLTPQQEADLNRVLVAWEQKSKEVNTFSCPFTQWQYDPPPLNPAPNASKSESDAPRCVNWGNLKYAAPDKGSFELLKTRNAQGQWAPIEEEEALHWICDGKSIFEYRPNKKTPEMQVSGVVVEHRLPPDQQGKAIVEGPLPFLFGAEAEKIRRRYFVRLIPPPPNKANEIWLEAYPRFQQDAREFSRATLILSSPKMIPQALELLQTDKKSRIVYAFDSPSINDPLAFLKKDPFKPEIPRGWQKVVEDPMPPAGAAPSSLGPSSLAQPPAAAPRATQPTTTPPTSNPATATQAGRLGPGVR
jgi:TIGR03009 family protein